MMHANMKSVLHLDDIDKLTRILILELRMIDDFNNVVIFIIYTNIDIY
jgi:hypothetical protein